MIADVDKNSRGKELSPNEAKSTAIISQIEKMLEAERERKKHLDDAVAGAKKNLENTVNGYGKGFIEGAVVAVGDVASKSANATSNTVRLARNIFTTNPFRKGAWHEGITATAPSFSETKAKQRKLDEEIYKNLQKQRDALTSFLTKAEELQKAGKTEGLVTLCEKYSGKKITDQEFTSGRLTEFTNSTTRALNADVNDAYQALDKSLHRAHRYLENAKSVNEMGGMMALSMVPGGAVIGPLLAGGIHSINEGIEQLTSVGLGVKTRDEAWGDMGKNTARHVTMAASFAGANRAFGAATRLISRTAPQLPVATTWAGRLRNALELEHGTFRGAFRLADSFRLRGIVSLPPIALPGARGATEAAVTGALAKKIDHKSANKLYAEMAEKFGEEFAKKFTDGLRMNTARRGILSTIMRFMVRKLPKLVPKLAVPLEADATSWNVVQRVGHNTLGIEPDYIPTITPLYNATQYPLHWLGGNAEPNDNLISYITGLDKLLMPSGDVTMIYLGQYNGDIVISGKRFDGVKALIHIDMSILKYTDKHNDIKLDLCDPGLRAIIVDDEKNNDTILYVDDGKYVVKISRNEPHMFTVTEGGDVPQKGEWVINSDENYDFAVQDEMLKFFMSAD